MKYFIASLAVLAMSLCIAPPVRADNGTCTPDDPGTLSETMPDMRGDFLVYIKLGLPGQRGHGTLIESESCRTIGATDLSGDTWSPAGSLTLATKTAISFQLQGEFAGSTAAARPRILLLPTSMPCQPTIQCNTTVDGAQAYLAPVSLTTTDSGLVVQKITDPSSDRTKTVQYYTDGQLMYTTPALQAFNLTYADYARQNIARVIVYESGQRAVLESITPNSYTDSVANFALRAFIRHSTVLITLLITLAILLVIAAARALSRHHSDTLYYNYAHGLGRKKLTALHARLKSIVDSRIFHYTSLTALIGASMVSLIVITNNLVITPYRVNGTSMSTALRDSQLLAVNRLPVTLARQFKPSRGQIVVFHPNYGTLAYSELRSDSYLVKRIVALPGERVVSTNGKLKVYTTAHPDGYYPEDTEPWGKGVTFQPHDEPFDITLANDEVFVVGDNRPDSVDSRINGALPLSEIIGVAVGY